MKYRHYGAPAPPKEKHTPTNRQLGKEYSYENN